MKRPLNFFKHQVPNYEKGLQSLIQISLSILNTVFVCNYDIESSYQKRKKMYRWIHVRLFLEYPKNTQVIMYTLLTCQWYQLHLTRFCIILPCLFITYKNSICFIGFHVLHVNKNLPKHIPNFLRRGVGIKIGIQFLSFIKSVYICTSSIDNF